MGKLKKIRRAVKRNPQLWMYKQRFPNTMYRARYATFIDGKVTPAIFMSHKKGYRMFVRKCIMDELGYTDNMIE